MDKVYISIPEAVRQLAEHDISVTKATLYTRTKRDTIPYKMIKGKTKVCLADLLEIYGKGISIREESKSTDKILNSSGMSSGEFMTLLSDIARNKDTPTATRLKALDQLGKSGFNELTISEEKTKAKNIRFKNKLESLVSVLESELTQLELLDLSPYKNIYTTMTQSIINRYKAYIRPCKSTLKQLDISLNIDIAMTDEDYIKYSSALGIYRGIWERYKSGEMRLKGSEQKKEDTFEKTLEKLNKERDKLMRETEESGKKREEKLKCLLKENPKLFEDNPVLYNLFTTSNQDEVKI